MADAKNIRNLAIVAHIDHGKTTLIDAIFKAARTFRESARIDERVMDSNELERERGITIRAKHCTVEYGGCLINIIDTPGHADFSGEVERVLSMADSVLLLVDANEGPMPQTRYVLMRSLKRGLRPIVIVNKADRPHADPSLALDKTFDLFVELGADDHQLDFPILYGSALQGWLVRCLDTHQRDGMQPLFETIIAHVPPPHIEADAPFRMQISSLAWSDYIGRIGCGRVLSGRHRLGDPILRTITTRGNADRHDGTWHVAGTESAASSHLWCTRGLERQAVDEISAGDIVWLAGPNDIAIGDTLSSTDFIEPALPPLDIEQPTVSMFFLVNTGPFAGNAGRAVTLREITERLDRELRVNVALRVEDVGRADGVKVSGRGELHLAILIEEMRREGMELCVSRPEVITMRDENGQLLEPMEQLIIDVPADYQGTIIEKVAKRKGELVEMHNAGTGMIRLEYRIPMRGLIGYRTEFLTDTRGLGIMASRFIEYGPWCGDVVARNRGSMVSTDTGEATAYALDNLQQRGTLFVSPLDRIYEGMIIGEHARTEDLPCNPTKKKHLTNHRSSTKDVGCVLKAPRAITLDTGLEWIAPDELLEVTPSSICVRKAVLKAEDRKRQSRQAG